MGISLVDCRNATKRPECWSDSPLLQFELQLHQNRTEGAPSTTEAYRHLRELVGGPLNRFVLFCGSHIAESRTIIVPNLYPSIAILFPITFKSTSHYYQLRAVVVLHHHYI